MSSFSDWWHHLWVQCMPDATDYQGYLGNWKSKSLLGKGSLCNWELPMEKRYWNQRIVFSNFMEFYLHICSLWSSHALYWTNYSYKSTVQDWSAQVQHIFEIKRVNTHKWMHTIGTERLWITVFKISRSEVAALLLWNLVSWTHRILSKQAEAFYSWRFPAISLWNCLIRCDTYKLPI